MQLLPNPAQSSVQLRFSNLTEAGEITLTSVSGQVLYKAQLAAGIYIVQLQSGNAKMMQKLIKN